jgi:DNA-binding NarL/FixJ family response regulator
VLIDCHPFRGPALPELKILIADDHELVRRGIRSLLEKEPGWKIVAEAANGHELLDKARELKPDIVVVDIAMPLLNGLEASRRLKKILPEAKILILTMHDSQQMARSVLDAGALGYVTKSEAARDLILAIEALRQNRTFFASHLQQVILESMRDGPPPSKERSAECLTSRQREIVQLLAEGKSSKEIAAILSLSVKTVETHRANIMKRLSCHSVSDLVIFAVRNEIVHV